MINELTWTTIAHTGVLFAIIGTPVDVTVGQKPMEFKADEQVPVTEFRLARTEAFGKRQAHMVEYQLSMNDKDTKDPFSVTVWIDATTSLPLKRVISGKLGDLMVTVTESYSSIALDGKLDETKFELPK